MTELLIDQMSVYVASSWRNPEQPAIVEHLRDEGFQTYDFRNPAPGEVGFSWKHCDASWEPGGLVQAAQLSATLEHPIARKGFLLDYDGMCRSWACVLALPCGRSAHLEAGWFTGKGRPLVVYAPEPIEPELMYLLGRGAHGECPPIVSVLAGVSGSLRMLWRQKRAAERGGIYL